MDRVYALRRHQGCDIILAQLYWRLGNGGGSPPLATRVLLDRPLGRRTRPRGEPFPPTTGAANSWTFWQYTSSGTVKVVGGRVDLNRYKFTTWTKVLIP